MLDRASIPPFLKLRYRPRVGLLHTSTGFPGINPGGTPGLDRMKPRLYIIAMATNQHELLLDDPALECDAGYFAARRTRTWPHRILSPTLQFLLWSLRIYVFVMLNVVIVEVMRTLVT